jgi:ketosteroid isomerase-like protein
MTLMDAQQYDEARGRRRRNFVIVGVIAALILAWVAYHLRSYPDRRAVDKFFAALQGSDLEGAYALWHQDPVWKQHPDKYSKYTFGDFTQDWSPSGEWGVIKSYSVDCSYSSGSGVIVQATVNGRTQHAFVWVDKSDKTLHFSPNEIDCGNWWGWLTE